MSSIYTPKVVISPLENSVVIAPDKTVVVVSSSGIQGASGGLRVLNIITTSALIPNIDQYDQINVTALASSLLVQPPIGTRYDAQKLLLRIKDNGNAQGILLDSGIGGYRAVGVVIPASTLANGDLYFGCIYNAQENYWDVIAVVQQ